ncbi:MAG: hypothetical protein AB1345_14945 [Chloroflexota bacterium]
MKRLTINFLLLVVLFLTTAFSQPAPQTQADNPNPPDHVVKLIFIHHSTGENWLNDDYGGLGLALGQNNYFVSDTNYGWGPDAIGDRTDIPNWVEWFSSENAPTYMDALYNEGNQNSWYTRPLSDPGGENEVILFKSCFPNSELGGNPDDPPGTYEEMTVGGAKYVYNQILQYFATRPDKLFVVITAPPVSNPTYAANARAFNQWLVNDWLHENNYPYNNVAVFDFYNVLTGPDNHHRFINGVVEHVFDPGRNTLFYPSDDDHPSAAGSRKATEEFVLLLNVFYHRWLETVTEQPPVSIEPQPIPAETEPPAGVPLLPVEVGTVDDFESGAPSGSSGWTPFWDEATQTRMACSPNAGRAHTGNQALQIDFEVVANSWATCALFFDTPQNWSTGMGLSFYLFADQTNQPFDVILYVGSPDNQETYIYSAYTSAVEYEDWVHYVIVWSEFKRAEWEENAGAAFTNPGQIIGMAFGMDGMEDANTTGSLWIDDLKLADLPSASSEPQAEPESKESKPFPCSLGLVLPLAFAGWAWFRRR